MPPRPCTSDRRLFDRRLFLQCSTVIAGSVLTPRLAPADKERPSLRHAIGIVSASADPQLKGRATGGRFTLLELPRILREELDMTVIDLNTSSFPDFANVTDAYLDKLRSAADEAGCVVTNLKMNQRGWDMNHRDSAVRERALREYERSIVIASRLGCRWARPLPSKTAPVRSLHVESYRRLCDFGAERDVQLLVENFGWMQADPESVVKLVKEIGRNVAAGVDTGNWDSDPIRRRGLQLSFPIAATCDFKARALGPRGEHPAYNLRACFDIAWSTGFRGPWCLEHANVDSAAFFKELALLRDMLRSWTAESQRSEE